MLRRTYYLTIIHLKEFGRALARVLSRRRMSRRALRWVIAIGVVFYLLRGLSPSTPPSVPTAGNFVEVAEGGRVAVYGQDISLQLVDDRRVFRRRLVNWFSPHVPGRSSYVSEAESVLFRAMRPPHACRQYEVAVDEAILVSLGERPKATLTLRLDGVYDGRARFELGRAPLIENDMRVAVGETAQVPQTDLSISVIKVESPDPEYGSDSVSPASQKHLQISYAVSAPGRTEVLQTAEPGTSFTTRMLEIQLSSADAAQALFHIRSALPPDRGIPCN
jgi:hypothetical protein